MARYSKTLERKAKSDPRVKAYYADSDGHWVDLHDGYKRWGEVSCVHEWTVAETLEAIRHDIERVDETTP